MLGLRDAGTSWCWGFMVLGICGAGARGAGDLWLWGLVVLGIRDAGTS